MPGEVSGTAANGPGERTQAASVDSLITRRRLIVYGVPALFMAVAFILYWYLGPQNTPAVNHVNQANAFLHGRLDIVPEYAKNINLIEKACDKIEGGACTADSKAVATKREGRSPRAHARSARETGPCPVSSGPLTKVREGKRACGTPRTSQPYCSFPSRTITSDPTRTVASGKNSHRTTPPRTLPPSSVLSPRLMRTTPLPYP